MLDGVVPYRRAQTATRDWAAFVELAAAAIPADVLGPGAHVGEAADAAGHHSLEQVDPVGVLGNASISGEGRLGFVPQGRGDQALDRTDDHLAVTLLGASAIRELALVDRVRDHVAYQPRSPDALGRADPDACSLAGAGGWDSEGVELERHPPAAPAIEGDPGVDPTDQVRGG